MTPEASAYFGKAQECLEYARANLAAGLSNDAGRNAYLAMFHAAQAFIFERTGKAAKTHTGVHTQFNRLAKAEPSLSTALRRALPQAYNLKPSRTTRPAPIPSFRRSARRPQSQRRRNSSLRCRGSFDDGCKVMD